MFGGRRGGALAWGGFIPGYGNGVSSTPPGISRLQAELGSGAAALQSALWSCVARPASRLASPRVHFPSHGAHIQGSHGGLCNPACAAAETQYRSSGSVFLAVRASFPRCCATWSPGLLADGALPLAPAPAGAVEDAGTSDGAPRCSPSLTRLQAPCFSKWQKKIAALVSHARARACEERAGRRDSRLCLGGSLRRLSFQRLAQSLQWGAGRHAVPQTRRLGVLSIQRGSALGGAVHGSVGTH